MGVSVESSEIISATIFSSDSPGMQIATVRINEAIASLGQAGFRVLVEIY